jgi:hypothetical protein
LKLLAPGPVIVLRPLGFRVVILALAMELARVVAEAGAAIIDQTIRYEQNPPTALFLRERENGR